MTKVKISDIDKPELLVALYNNAIPLGLGWTQYEEEDMTIKEAQEMIDAGLTKFDYIKGRVLKIYIGGDEMETRLYNRDNGEGAAEKIIEDLRKKNK